MKIQITHPPLDWATTSPCFLRLRTRPNFDSASHDTSEFTSVLRLRLDWATTSPRFLRIRTKFDNASLHDTGEFTSVLRLQPGQVGRCLLLWLIGFSALERAVPRTPRCRPFFELAGRPTLVNYNRRQPRPRFRSTYREGLPLDRGGLDAS